MQVDSPTTLRSSHGHNASQDIPRTFVNPLRSNPRFSYLQKWSEEDLANKENLALPQSIKVHPLVDSPTHRARKPLDPKRGLGISISTAASTPSARTLYDSPMSSGPTTVHRHRTFNREDMQYHVVDDPFVVQPEKVTTPTVDIGELSRTLASLQMMMNHTIVRMDALAEKQHVFTEAIERLQNDVATNTSRIAFLEAAQNVEDDSYRTEGLYSPQPRGLRLTAATLNTVDNKQDIGIDLWSSKSATGRAAERGQTRSHRPLIGEKRISTLSTTMSMTMLQGQTAALHKSRSAGNMSTQSPRDKTIEILQKTVDQQNARIKKLVAANRDCATPAVEQVSSALRAMRQRVDHLQTSLVRENETSRRHPQEQTGRLDRLQTDVDRSTADMHEFNDRMIRSRADREDVRTARVRDDGVEQQQAVLKMCCQMMNMMQAQQQRSEELLLTRDDVVPLPTRKMNRKLVGHVCSRGQT